MQPYAEIAQVDGDLAKKDKYISFRLLLSEVSELDELAKKEKLDRSKFIRSRIFSQKDAAA
jgi:Ribbon-helix-helix protein, copG family